MALLGLNSTTMVPMIRARTSLVRDTGGHLWPLTWTLIAVNFVLHGDMLWLFTADHLGYARGPIVVDLCMMTVLIVAFGGWFILRWLGRVSAGTGAGFAIAGAALALRGLTCIAFVTTGEWPPPGLADHPAVRFIGVCQSAAVVAFVTGLVLVLLACVFDGGRDRESRGHVISRPPQARRRVTP